MQSVRETFESIRLQNERAYGWLFTVEVALRELIGFELEAQFGKNWPKQGLPPDIREKFKAARSHELNIPWARLTSHHPLYYIDFPDLKKIIINGTNWSAAFKTIFLNKAGVDAALSDLEALRNKIAHSRFVSNQDLEVMQAAYSKIIGSIPEEKLTAVMRAACRTLPIVQILKHAHLGATAAFETMKTGSLLQNEAVEWCESLSVWWFDDAYLGIEIEPVQKFIGFCGSYLKIPAGIGQALARRRWVDEHNALGAGRVAITILESAIASAERHYGN